MNGNESLGGHGSIYGFLNEDVRLSTSGRFIDLQSSSLTNWNSLGSSVGEAVGVFAGESVGRTSPERDGLTVGKLVGPP